MERNLGTSRIVNEPPGVSEDSCAANVNADNHVSEEKPLANKRLTTVPWRHSHNGVISRIETEGCGRQTVRHKVDPEKLHRDQSLRHSKKNRQENTVITEIFIRIEGQTNSVKNSPDDFTNIRRNYNNSKHWNSNNSHENILRYRMNCFVLL